MPRVIVQAFAGRTLAQKRNLIAGVADAVSRSFGVPIGTVSIVIQEFTPENFGQGGVLEADITSPDITPEPAGAAQVDG